MAEVNIAALKAEHARGYITLRDGTETPGSCETCVPVRPFPCAAWQAADELEKARTRVTQLEHDYRICHNDAVVNVKAVGELEESNEILVQDRDYTQKQFEAAEKRIEAAIALCLERRIAQMHSGCDCFVCDLIKALTVDAP